MAANRSDRPFDIIVYGATGFTGRLVAEYLASHYAGRDDAPRWAMAGRSAAKLAQVRDAIGAPAQTPLIIADVADPASLAAMAASARAVITTVGPYQLYGEPVLKACIDAGTHYADLCGEPLWMRAMIDRHGDAASAGGARISFSSGFDSIPFDLGVVMLQRECMSRFGKPAPRVKGRMRGMKGGFSGGTAASLKEAMALIGRDRSLIGLMTDPFALTPGFTGAPQPPDGVQFDAATGQWAAPFIMAPINTKNVHRTNFLLGHPWGRDFIYDELLLTGPGDAGEAAARFMASAKMIGTDSDPQPGEGPSLSERETGFYDVLMIGEMPGCQVLRYGIKGRYDPGYGSTSRMICETAMALLESDAPGGIGTPGSILGAALVERLRAHAEITFEVED